MLRHAGNSISCRIQGDRKEIGEEKKKGKEETIGETVGGAERKKRQVSEKKTVHNGRNDQLSRRKAKKIVKGTVKTKRARENEEECEQG